MGQRRKVCCAFFDDPQFFQSGWHGQYILRLEVFAVCSENDALLNDDT